MLRIIIGLLIAAHGLGHILFLVPLLGFAEWGQTSRSWLLTGESSARLIGGLIWLVTILLYGGAVFGLWTVHSWWREVAVIASVISIVGLILFWINPPTAPVISALIFNILVLVALLIVRFPTMNAVGA